jgi:hypothetical protein
MQPLQKCACRYTPINSLSIVDYEPWCNRASLIGRSRLVNMGSWLVDMESARLFVCSDTAVPDPAEAHISFVKTTVSTPYQDFSPVLYISP